MNANSERAIEEAREIRIAFNLLQTVAVAFLQQLIAANAVTRKAIKAIILSLTENKKKPGSPAMGIFKI